MMLKNLYIIVIMMVGCLPQNKSFLNEDLATEAQIQELMTLLKEKTGVASSLKPNVKLLQPEAAKLKEIVSGLNVPDKRIFSIFSEFIIQSKSSSTTEIYKLDLAKKMPNNMLEKMNLNIEISQLTSSRDSAKFLADLQFHAAISTELAKFVPEFSKIGLNVELLTGINYKDLNFTKERETKIIQKLASLKASISPLLESAKPLLLTGNGLLVLDFNSENTQKVGSSYVSGFTSKSSIVERPVLTLDMSGLNDAQVLIKSVTDLKSNVAAIEQEANAKIGQGIQLRLSFGKTIRDIAQLRAFALDPAMHKKLIDLKKSTDLTNFYWLDRFSSEEIFTTVGIEGIYLSVQLKDKQSYDDYLGGFLAIAEGDVNEGTHRIALSFPPDVESFVVRSADDPTKIIYSTPESIKSSLESGVRNIFSSKEKLDLGDGLKMQIDSTYKSKKVFKHTISVVKQPS